MHSQDWINNGSDFICCLRPLAEKLLVRPGQVTREERAQLSESHPFKRKPTMFDSIRSYTGISEYGNVIGRQSEETWRKKTDHNTCQEKNDGNLHFTAIRFYMSEHHDKKSAQALRRPKAS